MEDARKTRQEHAGFTLVELVVVIAILGVLAGVAYAGYGGYIKYAKRAGDEDLIAAVNAAFASACEEQGVARTKMGFNAAKLSWGEVNDDGKQPISGVESVNGLSDESSINAFRESFGTYFGDNNDKTLKAYLPEDVIFVNGNDLFTLDPEKGRNGAFISSSFGSGKIYEGEGSAADGTLKDLGFLSSTIDDIFTNPAGLLVQFNNGNTIDNFGDFLTFMQNKKGTVAAGLSMMGLGDIASIDFSEFGDKYGLTDESSMQQVSNAILLYAADMAKEGTKTQADTTNLVKNYNSEDRNKGMLSFMLQIGEMEGYYRSGYASQEFIDKYQNALKNGETRSLYSLMNNIKGDTGNEEQAGGYAEYLKSGKQENDLYGYLAGMAAISDNGDKIKDAEDADGAFSSLLDVFNSTFGG